MKTIARNAQLLMLELGVDRATDLARGALKLNEVRAIRLRMLVAFLDDPSTGQAKRIVALDRYEKTARRVQQRVLRAFRNDV